MLSSERTGVICFGSEEQTCMKSRGLVTLPSLCWYASGLIFLPLPLYSAGSLLRFSAINHAMLAVSLLAVARPSIYGELIRSDIVRVKTRATQKTPMQ